MTWSSSATLGFSRDGAAMIFVAATFVFAETTGTFVPPTSWFVARAMLFVAPGGSGVGGKTLPTKYGQVRNSTTQMPRTMKLLRSMELFSGRRQSERHGGWRRAPDHLRCRPTDGIGTSAAARAAFLCTRRERVWLQPRIASRLDGNDSRNQAA